MQIFMIFLFLLLPLCAQDAPDSDTWIVKVQIVPDSVSLLPGESVQFRYLTLDKDGKEIPAALEWNFSGGDLQQDGTYIAGKIPGEYFLEAMISTGIKGTAKIIIREPEGYQKKAVRLVVTPAQVQLKPGDTCLFSFRAYDSLGNPFPTPLRIAMMGGKMDTEGIFTAGDVPGVYFLSVSTPDGLAAKAQITIIAKEGVSTAESPVVKQESIAAKAEIVPPFVKLLPGEKCQFVFHLYDVQGKKVTDSISLMVQGGKMTEGGLFTAGPVPGEYLLEMTTPRGLRAQAKIQIEASKAPTTLEPSETTKAPLAITPGEAVELQIIPKEVKLQSGQKHYFRFVALDENATEVKAAMQIQFTGGKLEKDGGFIAGNVGGKYQIVATYKNLKAVANVEIEGANAEPIPAPRILTQLKIVPAKVRIKPGEAQKFTILATDKDGNPASGHFSWISQGGLFKEDGTFTAGTIVGQYPLIAIHGETGMTAKAMIAIVDPITEPKEMFWLQVEPSQIRVKKGETCVVSYTVVNDQGGTVLNMPLQWKCQGGTLDPATLIFKAGDVSGDFYLYAEFTDHIRTRIPVVIE